MIATLDFMKKAFDTYNAKYFNGELPTPAFELFEPRTTLGQFQACQRLDRFANPYHKCIIRLSVYYDRPEHDLNETMVHEMCHYWIHFKGIQDNGSHGKQWKALAESISKKGEFNISRCSSTVGCTVNPEIKKRKERTCADTATVFAYRKNGKYMVFLVGATNVNKYKNWIQKEVANKFSYIEHAFVGTVKREDVFEHMTMCRTKVRGYWYAPDAFLRDIYPLIENVEKYGNTFKGE